MNEIIAILGATILMLSMAKKTKMPLFGQLTLTGEKALDWVKNPTEITAKIIWFCSVNALHDWNVPEWAKDKGIVALIFPTNEWGNPVFVTQNSILKVLESMCADWETKGASCKVIGTKIQGQKTQIMFEENEPTFKFSRPENCKTYDPYIVEVL
jgi:hypothetical protein|tara:strand:- start:559 stop:1023 length:465 start_codon:yes stop_codon:yes gene_type:complete